MSRSNRSEGSSQVPCTDALACTEPAPQRAFLPSTEKLEDAARTFSLKRDVVSFTMLYLAAQKPMTRVVSRGGVHEADVEDVVSISAAAIWFSRELFEGQTFGEFAAYSLAITRRKVLRWREQEWRYHRVPVVQMATGESHEDLAGAPTLSAEDIAALREAFGRLVQPEQTALRMYFEGWSFREIGETLGCDKNAARVVYLEAVEHMRRMLK